MEMPAEVVMLIVHKWVSEGFWIAVALAKKTAVAMKRKWFKDFILTLTY